MAIINCGNEVYTGLSTDTKPTDVPAGARFIETNTGKDYAYNGTTWVYGYRVFQSARYKRYGWFYPQNGTNSSGGLLAIPQTTTTPTANAPTSTSGTSWTWPGSATANTVSGWASNVNVQIVHPGLNPRFTMKFKLTYNNSSVDSRFWCGFTNSATLTTLAADDPLNTIHGVLFGFRAADTTFQIAHSAGSGTTYTDTTVAIDATNTHIIEIILGTGAATWQLDSGTVTALGSVFPTNAQAVQASNSVPGTSNAKTWIMYWAEVESDPGTV